MIASLIRKELRQHWFVLLLVAFVLFFGFAVLMLNGIVSDNSLHPYEVMQRFLLFFSVTAAMVICNRLVVVEYAAKTQLFLEALPLSRAMMIIVKWLLGFSVLLLSTAILFGLSTLLATRVEALETRHVAIVAVRTVTLVLCIYSFFFMMGLLGRYRVTIYLLLLIGFSLLEQMTEVQVGEFGPFHLMIDQRFAFERSVIPWGDLWPTWILTASFVGVTLLLSLIREGSVANLLAEKMSYREKVFVSCLVLAAIVAGSLYDSKVVRKPYDLANAASSETDRVQVKVSMAEGKDSSKALADRTAKLLSEVAEFLKIKSLPPVFIVLRQDLDASKYERGELEKAEGLLVRANFLSPEWNEAAFQMWIIREAMINMTDGIELRESKRWVLDGFPAYWAANHDAQMAKNFDRRTWELRAAYGGVQGHEDGESTEPDAAGFSVSDAETWLSFRDRVGDPIATAVAFAGLEFIRNQYGQDKCDAFLRHTLHHHATDDFRVFYNESVYSVAKAANVQFGTSTDELFPKWVSEVQRLGEVHTELLKRLPVLQVDAEWESLSTESRRLLFSVRSSADAGKWAELRHVPLESFQTVFDEYDVLTERFPLTTTASGEATETFTRGDRIAWTFAVDVPDLGCEIISGWQIKDIK